MIPVMTQVVHSNNPQALAAQLAAQLSTQPDHIFTPRQVVVPNPSSGKWLKMELARLLGYTPSLSIATFEASLQQWVTLPGARVVNRQALRVMLLLNLPLLLQRDGDSFAPVTRWLWGEHMERRTSPESDERLAQLAHELSGIFWEYLSSRHAMMSDWAKGISSLDAEGKGAFFGQTLAWQKLLWKQLFGKNGVRDSLALKGTTWLLPSELLTLPPAHLTAHETIHLFTLAGIPPMWQGILTRLSQQNHLHFFYANPCREFWEDIVKDPEGEEFLFESSLLARWGKAGTFDLRFLGTLTGYDDTALFDDPGLSQDSFFCSLRETILSRGAHPLSAPDGTVKIMGAPSHVRECEIVANEIQALMESDPSLTYPDICVILADSEKSDIYGVHLRSAFELAEIPCSLVDGLDLSGQLLLDTLKTMLELPGSAMDRGVMLRLLDNPLTGGAFYEERDFWLDTIDTMGLYSEDTPGPRGRELHSWQRGLTRLVRGALFHRSGDTLWSDAPELCLNTPYTEISFERAAPVVTRIRSFIDDARFISASKMSLPKWIDLIARYFALYVRPRTEQEEHTLGVIRERLSSLTEQVESLSLTRIKMGWQLPKNLVLDLLEGMRVRHTGYTARGVTIASLSALRALPARWVFVMGLSDGAFPSRERHSILDLRAMEPRFSDISTRDRDLYSLLELLTRTTEGMRFSYVHTQSATGQTLQPATPLRVLMEHLSEALDTQTEGSLHGRLARAGVLEHHPPHPWDQRYFPALTNALGIHSTFAPSRSRSHYTAALAALSGEVRHPRERPNEQPSATPGVPDVITLPALERFIRNPMQGSLMIHMGLWREETRVPLFDQGEGFTIEMWQRKRLIREVLVRSYGTHPRPSPAQLLIPRIARAMESGEYPPDLFAPGLITQDLAELAQYEAIMEAWLAALNAPRAPLKEISLGRRRTSGQLLLEPLTLTLPCGDRCTINGSLMPVIPSLGVVFDLPLGSTYTTGHLLTGWLHGVVLACLGYITTPRFMVAGLTNKKVHSTSFTTPSPAEAARFLGQLIQATGDAENRYNLPIEKVMEATRKKMSPEALRRWIMSSSAHESGANRAPLEWGYTLEPHPSPLERATELLSGDSFSCIREYLGEELP